MWALLSVVPEATEDPIAVSCLLEGGGRTVKYPPDWEATLTPKTQSKSLHIIYMVIQGSLLSGGGEGFGRQTIQALHSYPPPQIWTLIHSFKEPGALCWGAGGLSEVTPF